MKLSKRYEIRIVIIEIKPDHTTGDCYYDLSLFKQEKPTSSYKFGYIVFDNETELVKEGCNDWNDTIEEALADYAYSLRFPEESTNEMPNKRKTELFSEAIYWVYEHTIKHGVDAYKEALKVIGFTPEEIKKEIDSIY
jgi:hypothetical protein